MFRVFVISLFVVMFATVSFADKTYDADVVIIGAGAGGTTAGVAALDEGFSVIVLEKMPTLGGSGNYMEGTFALESPMQIQENIAIPVEEQFNRTMDFHHWRINAHVLNNWLKETGSGIVWLMSKGIKFEKVTTAFPNGYRTWHMFEGGHGSSLIKLFSEEIKKKGGLILTETPAERLIMENGKVVGVIASDDSGKVTVKAKKAVIIASGGFPCNDEMIKKYLPYKGYTFLGAEGRTGDGIRMMEAAGAELANMNVVMQAGLWLKDVPSAYLFSRNAKYTKLMAAVYQPYLKVDVRGNRVVNETKPLEFLSNAFEEAGGEAFVVFDENTKLEMQNVGLIAGWFGLVKRMEKFSDFDAVFSEAIKDKVAFKANTLDELAKQTGMNPAILKKTAERMTAMTKEKYDDQFYKSHTWLRALDKGPFYAIKTSLRMYSTAGGAKVNEHFQVLTKDFAPIPNLYAIGQDAGGLYSDSYDMSIAEGTASSWAINGGRLAVRHIKYGK
jgi:fumarate reductase flavoprotein subunit